MGVYEEKKFKISRKQQSRLNYILACDLLTFEGLKEN